MTSGEDDRSGHPEFSTLEVHEDRPVTGLVDHVRLHLEGHVGGPEIAGILGCGDACGDHLHPVTHMKDHSLLECGGPVLDKTHLSCKGAGHLDRGICRDDVSPL